MRASGRNEHAATRSCTDGSISTGRFPVMPRFLCTFDRLKRQDVELSFQDIEELFRAAMGMRTDIETGRHNHLETGYRGAVRRSDLEGNFLRFCDQLPTLTGWN